MNSFIENAAATASVADAANTDLLLTLTTTNHLNQKQQSLLRTTATPSTSITTYSTIVLLQQSTKNGSTVLCVLTEHVCARRPCLSCGRLIAGLAVQVAAVTAVTRVTMVINAMVTTVAVVFVSGELENLLGCRVLHIAFNAQSDQFQDYLTKKHNNYSTAR